MFNRACLGLVSEDRIVDVELGQIKLFSKAIGETNPIYFDESAAKKAGLRGVKAPLTFGFCLKSLAPAKYPSNEDLGIDFSRLLHAEEKFDYFLPIYSGDRLTFSTEVEDMYEKKGGALDFLIRTTKVFNEAGELVQTQTNTLVMRNG
ncbi:MaoC family dehydratase [Pseudomaricurvus alkylphenolicus]|uniref:MaoC family dehydratase N-terminal domain-containing protein n=1 Tax=Pseudomaricurvus alkylphenolicus TaxID=1306991 RepID=UPI001423CDED|nr:MaoC family dehydratase N-terminal domain-containing protein [Pseudomaricurvus alkylphenolicus]NIB38200.1 MaoC family dehydratase [Pseudomaricurvus alkylphenolicus]